MLCQMAQTGQLGGKMTESDLKNLLERFITSQQTSLSDHFSRGSDLKNLLERLSFHNDPILMIIFFSISG